MLDKTQNSLLSESPIFFLFIDYQQYREKNLTTEKKRMDMSKERIWRLGININKNNNAKKKKKGLWGKILEELNKVGKHNYTSQRKTDARDKKKKKIIRQ